jgi:ADP-ribose pyrophosphatase
MRKTIYDGIVVNLHIDEVRLPNGHTTRLEVMTHPGAAAVVPLFADGRIAILRQYRHAVGGWLWEVPAGKLDRAGEDPLECAKRELGEEAGLAAERWRKLGSIYTTPGFCNEIIHLYLARVLSEVERAHEANEVIEVHRLPLTQALAMIPTEEIRDTKTVAALQATALLLGAGLPSGWHGRGGRDRGAGEAA